MANPKGPLIGDPGFGNHGPSSAGGASGYELNQSAARRFELQMMNDEEAHRLLDLIDVEFRTDPMSVRCFDLRVVEQVKKCVVERKRLVKERGF